MFHYDSVLCAARSLMAGKEGSVIAVGYSGEGLFSRWLLNVQRNGLDSLGTSIQHFPQIRCDPLVVLAFCEIIKLLSHPRTLCLSVTILVLIYAKPCTCCDVKQI